MLMTRLLLLLVMVMEVVLERINSTKYVLLLLLWFMLAVTRLRWRWWTQPVIAGHWRPMVIIVVNMIYTAAVIDVAAAIV